jgi:hypothetical protein
MTLTDYNYPFSTRNTSVAVTGGSTPIKLEDWMGGKAVDPRTEGIKCDNVTDDTAAWTAAIAKWSQAGGALVQIPRGLTSLTSKSPILKPNIWIEGASPGSGIRNAKTDPTADFRSGFIIGDFHPYVFDTRNDATGRTLARYPINDATRGNDKVTPTGADGVAACPVGMFVWVRSTTEWLGANWTIPVYAILTYVVANDGTNITLADGLEQDLTGGIGLISPVVSTVPDSVLGIPWAVSANNVIRNITIDSDYPIGARSAGYKVGISDLVYPNTVRDLTGSACFSHGYIRNIRGRWSRACCEVACFSRDMIIEGCYGDFDSGPGAAANPFKIGENASHIRVRDCQWNIGPGWAGSGFFPLTIQGCRDVTIEDCVFRRGYAGGGVLYGVSVEGGSSVNNYTPARNVKLHRNVFDMGPQSTQGIVLFGFATSKDQMPSGEMIGNDLLGNMTGGVQWLSLWANGFTAIGNRVPVGTVVASTGSTNFNIPAGYNFLMN